MRSPVDLGVARGEGSILSRPCGRGCEAPENPGVSTLRLGRNSSEAEAATAMCRRPRSSGTSGSARGYIGGKRRPRQALSRIMSLDAATVQYSKTRAQALERAPSSPLCPAQSLPSPHTPFEEQSGDAFTPLVFLPELLRSDRWTTPWVFSQIASILCRHSSYLGVE